MPLSGDRYQRIVFFDQIMWLKVNNAKKLRMSYQVVCSLLELVKKVIEKI